MFIYYVLLISAGLLFSIQFLATKLFEKYNKPGLKSTLKLIIYAYITIALFFFIKAQITAGKFVFGFSWFTVIICIILSLITILCLLLGSKALEVGNMSVYSSFMMVGSLVLPSLCGILIYKEQTSILKILALLLMIVAAFGTFKKSENQSSKKAIFYYIGVFILNGSVGVLFTIYLNHPELAAYAVPNKDGILEASSDFLLTYYGVIAAIVSLIVYLIIKNKDKEEVTEKAELKEIIYSISCGIIYGLVNGIGNYFIAISTLPTALGSSLSFPIVNGGCILFSTLIGAISLKEKLSIKEIISLVLVVISMVLFIL